ncbi:MAG: 5'-nucleotidase C-terminal domain-containing protein [Vampirovibrionales bacterium]|nr:5'-nucleotidase C-terminal domain-containing protein [Vampirovibrionales bacterium]
MTSSPAQTCITLFTLNDVYQMDPVDAGKRGGLGRVATLLGRLRADHPNSLFILAGDTLAPSLESKLTEGAHMVEAWNALGIQLATLGNHEFDFGPDVLAKRIAESKFPWIVGNVYQNDAPYANLKPYEIQTWDGIKVGFFGVLTPETLGISKAGAEITIEDPLKAAQRAVKALKKQKVDVIVAVTHLSLGEDILLARQVPGIDLIVGGHEHTLIELLVGKVPIFKVGSDARNLGHIQLTVNQKTRKLDNIQWEVIPVTDATEVDPAFEQMMVKHRERLNEQFGQTVAHTQVVLNAKQAAVRTQENNTANLIADAYRELLKTDIGWINGGAIRANRDFAAGAITYRDVYSLLPFGNKIYKLSLSGRQIKSAIEHSLGQLTRYTEPGGFIQVSGMRFEADLKRPAGDRILKLERSDGTPIQWDKSYTVAMPDFIARGGNGYDLLNEDMFIDMELQHDATLSDAELFASYLEALMAEHRPIAPQVEGRMVIHR